MSASLSPFEARYLSLGRDWDGRDVSGWQASEKLDGVRVRWDGHNLWLRSGNRLESPPWITAGLPRVHLDAELWAGRGRFEVARQAVQLGRWTPELRLAVFDAPLAGGDWLARMAEAERLLAGHPVAFAVERWTVASRRDFWRAFTGICGQGGEGIVVRQPGAGYAVGRTGTVLKVKSLFP